MQNNTYTNYHLSADDLSSLAKVSAHIPPESWISEQILLNKNLIVKRDRLELTRTGKKALWEGIEIFHQMRKRG